MESKKKQKMNPNLEAEETNTPPQVDGHIDWVDTADLIWSKSDKSQFREKIAGFDMDHTLLKPKSGAKFPKNRGDWQYWHDQVKPKL